MPCNIGYKSYAEIRIPAPQPQTFRTKSEAPAIDADLLEKLGIEDAQFLEWVSELDTKPLLEEALKRALAKVSVGDLKFRLNDQGMLEAKGSYLNASQKAAMEKTAAAVSARWQFEILGIVAELLNYNVTVSQSGSTFTLEAEELGKTHPCNYIKIVKSSKEASLVFEHFKDRGALKLETAKFLALADRLGVKINMQSPQVSEGDPFPGEVRHTHDHRHGHSHDHGKR